MKKKIKRTAPIIVIVSVIIILIIVYIIYQKRLEYYDSRVYLNNEHVSDKLPSYWYDNKYGITGPREEDGYVIWDSIYFGEYYQNNDTQKEPIQWRVLSVDSDSAFLISEKALDCQKYNNKLENVTWETCSLRKWLNKTFYEEAFDESEKNAIYSTTVKNKFYYRYSEPGNNTEDKIYLLSTVEHHNSLLGFCYDNVNRKMANLCKPTEYAKSLGCSYDNNEEGISDGAFISNEKFGACSWWFRDPYDHNTSAYSITYRSLMSRGEEVNQNGIGVRPVININLSSRIWKKGKTIEAVIDNDSINILGY